MNAVLYARGVQHARADAAWRALLNAEPLPVTSNYVVVEAFALVQSRFGMDAVRRLHEEILPPLTVEWVTEADHHAAVAAVLAADRRPLSLVDCASFEGMRRLGTQRAFAFDPHFEELGFEPVPAVA